MLQGASVLVVYERPNQFSRLLRQARGFPDLPHMYNLDLPHDEWLNLERHESINVSWTSGGHTALFAILAVSFTPRLEISETVHEREFSWIAIIALFEVEASKNSLMFPFG